MSGSAIVYPAPEGLDPSPHCRVWADGREVFVHRCEVADYSIFAMTGPVEVAVEFEVGTQGATIRPLSRDIEPEVQGGRISFGLDSPACLSVERDDGRRPLFLFAAPPEEEAPSPDAPSVRYFEAGRIHTPGLMEMRDGETIHIEGGAVVRGAVLAEDAENVTVRGRGVLDGSDWSQDGKERGPWLLRFVGCRGVRVQGITAVESPRWTCPVVGCSEVAIRGLKIITWLCGRDGVDLVGSRDAIVEDCFIRAGDDCVAVKASTYRHDIGGGDVRNIRVEGCTLWNDNCGNGLEIGYETRCDSIRDVTFRDCDIIHTEFEGHQSGAALSIHNGDRAEIGDILYEDIRIEDAQEKLVDLKVLLAKYSRDEDRGQIGDVRFRNVRVVGGPFPVSIVRGYDEEHMIGPVTFENLRIHGQPVANARDAHMVVELAPGVRFSTDG